MQQLFLEAKKTLKHVGIFVQMPDYLGKKFPKLANDDSPAHVTTLYLGDQSPSDEDHIVAAVVEAVQDVKPFEISMNGLGYFNKNKDGDKIAFVKILSPGLRAFRNKLVKSMKKHGVEWKDSYGTFKPHSTLKYFDGPDGDYEGAVPAGSWTCKDVRVWGFDKKHTVHLAK